MEAKDLMVVHSTDGQGSEILGKFLYYSFPRLMIDREQFRDLVARYGFPASTREKHSAIDAFRCATTDVRDRIVEEELKIMFIKIVGLLTSNSKNSVGKPLSIGL